MKKCIVLLFLILALAGGAMAQGLPKGAYVLNSLGQNLSVINLQNGNVTLDALPLGLYTNAIKIRNESAYVVNSGVNEIQVISLNPLATVDHIDVGNSTSPWSMDFVNDSIAVVSLLAINQVGIVNVNSGQVQYIAVGTGPQGVKYYNGKIYVANAGYNGGGYDPGTVSVIDASTFNVVDTYNVGINPWDTDVDSQGRLVVVCAGDYASVTGQMDIIDLNNGNVVNTIPFTSSPTSVGINSLDQCYIGTYGSGVAVYNLITQSFGRDESNPLPGGPGIEFDQQDNVYITDFVEDSVRVYSSSHQKIASYKVGDGPASIAIATFINPPVVAMSEKFYLFQNYPNPFNQETVISYQLRVAGDVELTVYNLLGEPIKTLVKGKQTDDNYKIVWDGKDNLNKLASSGVYFYRLKIGDQYKVHQMRLIR